MKYCNLYSLLGVAAATLILFSCSAKPQQVQQDRVADEVAVKESVTEAEEVMESAKEVIEEKKIFAPTKEEKESLQLFTQLLELVDSTDDRRSILPQIEATYKRIIDEYPGAPLAQESYWKLIEMYVRDYSPPAYDKIDDTYAAFAEKHPESFLKPVIEDTIANALYRNKEWGRLLKFCEPFYGDYVDKAMGNSKPALIFKCAEAHYYLDNRGDAEKGYRVLSDLFPKTRLGLKSRSMLRKIQEEYLDTP